MYEGVMSLDGPRPHAGGVRLFTRTVTRTMLARRVVLIAGLLV